jgi:16S rRNA processing protein RimM
MNKDDFFYFGKIHKAYGNRGHVLAHLDVDNPEKYQNLESVFIGIDEDRIPFFITSIEFKPKNQAIILFEDTSSVEDAEIFEKRELFLPVTMLPKLSGKKFYYHEVVGFRVIDESKGDIGILKSVMEMPQQALLQIQFGPKEILIPLTDQILKKVDRVKKELRISAPEGLIEIYL